MILYSFFFMEVKVFSYLDPRILDIVVFELTELTSADAFKKVIQEYNPKNCICRFCKQCISNLGFITITL